jgi:FKBP-type peptidyl-prolyl cis-trans isomerase SlpA
MSHAVTDADPPETPPANDASKETATETAALLAPGLAVELHLEVRFQDGFVALSTFDADDDANIHWMERGDFPPDIAPVPGLVVAFETPGGHETSGVVRALDADRVQVDFKHPFAGLSLTIRVRVLSVAEPEAEAEAEADG